MGYLSFHSSIGDLTVFEDQETLISVDWGWAPDPCETPLLVEARSQIEAYLDGTLRAFDLPLNALGSKFQQAVWAEMQRIPYGQTRSYGDLARDLNTAPRAIGAACGRNPLPILIPCHRVLGSNGSLGGYSGAEGVETKRRLLELERRS